MKTSELSGAALDWAVAKCEGVIDRCEVTCIENRLLCWEDGERMRYAPSDDWAQGGPIIEREEIELHKWALDGWEARATNYSFLNTPNERPEFARQHGPTPLIAAMRCVVASRLGDEVQVPEGLK